jgi:hypothetical protein
MRVLFLAATVAFLTLSPSAPAHAQRTMQATADDQRAPANVRFRPRSAEERLTTLRRLDAQTRQRTPGVAPPPLVNITLADSFSRTPRTPFVPGQGALTLHYANRSDAHAAPSGEARFPSNTYARAMLHINNPARRRLLIECTVWSDIAGSFDGLLIIANTVQWQDSSAPYANVISFWTPPMPEGASSEIQFTVRRPSHGDWSLLGCEVTRMAAQ